MIIRTWLWIRSVLFRTRLERDMEEEMGTHLRRSIERFEHAGLSPAAAGAAARLEFGNVTAIKEDARDARGGRWLESVFADLRYGARSLARTPVSTLTMIVVFALGIGCNAALFVFISSMVNSPVPGIPRDDSLVRIRGIERRPGSTVGREFSYPEYRDYAAQTRLFASVAAWTSADVVLGAGGGERGGREVLFSGAATYVTANYFQVLGVSLANGGGLPVNVPDVGGEPPLVAVISHVVWERCFGLAHDVVGRPVTVNGIPVTIVGVAPRHFSGARTGGSQMRVWLPLATRTLLQRNTTDFTSYDPAFLGLAARLQPGITPNQTLPTLDAIGVRSMQLATNVESGGRRSTDVAPMLAGNYFPPSGDTPDPMQRVASLVMPLLILLVTCTNVSAMLAGLAIARRSEIAVRLSLGAPRRRIVRQLVTESILLAVTAGASALLVIWILLLLVESSVADVHLTIDWRVFLFTLALAVTAGVLFGLSPALHGTRLSLSEVLKDAAGSLVPARTRLQSGLVVAQIALTQPLLLGLGAFILELREDLGKMASPFYADRVLEVRFNTNPRYGSIDQTREKTLQRLRERFSALPGVVTIVPQQNTDDFFAAAVHHADRTGEDSGRRLMIRAHAAPSGYFSLMGIPVVRGRDFDIPQREDRTAVVIGTAVASRLWPGANPIGRRLIGLSPTERGSIFTVVGVVDETKAGLRESDGEIKVYVPDVQVTGHLLIRTQARAQSMLPVIRETALIEAPDLPLVSASTLEAVADAQRTTLTRIMTVVGSGGALALFLSAIGLYAVVTFAVRQRVREIGIRAALGASARQLALSFLMRSLRLSLGGLALGLALSVIVLRLMRVAGGDGAPPGIVRLAIVVAGAAVAVALVASWVPARRAASIDPLLALRVQ